jgi:hypothetical protein
VSVRQADTTITVALLAERNRTPWEVSSCSRCVSCVEEPHLGELSSPRGNLRVHPVARCLVAATPLCGATPPGQNHKAPGGLRCRAATRVAPQSGACVASRFAPIERRSSTLARSTVPRLRAGRHRPQAADGAEARAMMRRTIRFPLGKRVRSPTERRSPPSGAAPTNRMRSSPQIDRCSAPRKSPTEAGTQRESDDSSLR